MRQAGVEGLEVGFEAGQVVLLQGSHQTELVSLGFAVANPEYGKQQVVREVDCPQLFIIAITPLYSFIEYGWANICAIWPNNRSQFCINNDLSEERLVLKGFKNTMVG